MFTRAVHLSGNNVRGLAQLRTHTSTYHRPYSWEWRFAFYVPAVRTVSRCTFKILITSLSTISHLEHSQLQLDKFSDHENRFIFVIVEKLFTADLLRTHKMIWSTRQWQPNSVTSASDVFCATVSNSVRLRSLLRYRNSIISASFLLNIKLKSTGSIIETCCWCRNCCQRSAALLETCLSSSKTVHCNTSCSWHRRAYLLIYSFIYLFITMYKIITSNAWNELHAHKISGLSFCTVRHPIY